ncbi:MAG: MFS transporter, partial [Candidatus Micrarchaeia archaeon]
YLCGFISRVGYAFAKSWQVIIPLRILDRAGKIRDAPRDAIIADEAKKHERGGHFGILKMMDALGGVFGIIACIILFKYLGYKNLFLLAAVPSLISVLLVLLFIKEGEHSKNGKKSEWLSFREMSRDLKMFLGISALFALASFSYSFLLVYAQRFGFSQAQIPVLYLIFVLVASIFSIPFGRLADRIGRKPVLMISFLLWGIVCWIFLVLKNYPSAIILSFIIYGMHRGAIEPVQRTFISELSPAEKRASSLGLLQLTVGMCALPSSLLTGLLWDRVGMFFPLTISLGITIGAILLLTYVKETESQLPVKA